MTWLDDYKAQLDAIVASKQQSVASTGNPSLSNAYALLGSIQGEGSLNSAFTDSDGTPTSKHKGSVASAWNATKSGGLRLLDLMSRPSYVSANVGLEIAKAGKASSDRQIAEHQAKGDRRYVVDTTNDGPSFTDIMGAAWKGLTGEDKTTYSEVLKAKGQDSGVGNAAGGFALDVALDPTTYLGLGVIKKGVSALKGGEKTATTVGRQAAKEALSTPIDRAASEFVGEGATKTDKTTANDLLEYLTRQRELADTKEGLAKIADTSPVAKIPEQSTGAFKGFDEVPTAAKVGNADELALLTARSSAEKASEILTKIPTRKYAKGTKIAPAFVEETPKPVAKAATKKTVAKKGRGLPTPKARALAFKQHILGDSSYQISVTAGGKPVKTSVARLRTMAEADPEKAKMIDSLINQEAIRLSKESPEYFGKEPLVNLTGRTGTGRAAVTVEQFQKLLETGEVPKIPGKSQSETRKFLEDDALTAKGDSPLDAFALHSKDDLATIHVSDISGKRESIGDYLKRLGIKSSTISPENAVSRSEALDPGSGVGGLGGVGGRETTAQASPGARYRAMSKDERAVWVAQHADVLDEADIKTLLSTKISAGSTKAYFDKVNEILNNVSPTSYARIEDLVAAIDSGKVDTGDLKDLMKITGAKTPAGIKRALTKLFKRVDELDAKAGAKRAESVDSKIWETPPIATVKPAEEIIDDVIEKGDLTELTDVKPVLDAKQVQDVQAGLGHLVQREIIDPQTAEKYGFVSRSGTKRTHKTMNKGLGRNLTQWGKFSQLSLISGIIKFRGTEISATIKSAGLKGQAARIAREDAMYQHTMPVMRTVDKMLKESGIPPMLSKNPQYVASLTDVLDHMPEAFVKKHFFDAVQNAEHIPPTFWNDAAEIVQDYAHGIIDYETAINGVRNTLLEKQTTRAGKTIYTGVRTKFYKIQDAVARENYVLGIAKEFMRTAGPLAQTIQRNLAEVVIHDANGAARVSDEAMKAITDLVSSPNFSAHDLLRVANDRDAIVESIAKSAGITSERAKQLAKSDILVKTSEMIPPEVAATAHNAKAIADSYAVEVGKTPKGREVITTHKKKQFNAFGKSLDDTEVSVKQVTDDLGESLTDIGKNNERTMGWSVLKAFAPHLGNKDIRPLFLNRNSFGQTVARSYAASLTRIAKSHSVSDIQAAWRELQMGTVPTEAATLAAHDDLAPVVNSLFGGDELNIFKSNGISADHVNSHFAKYGLGDKFKFNDDFSNWKSWDVPDPLEHLSRLQAAIQMSKIEITVGADLSRQFGSKIPTPGSIRISGGGSVLGRFIDPTVYFPEDIAKQLPVLDQAMKQMQTPENASKALRLYDTVLHSYKSGLTIYRPGHHIRNMVGDMWLSWMDGVNNPAVYKHALHVMADNHGRYEGFDARQALNEQGIHNAKSGRKVATTTVNGKRVDLTTGQVYQMAYSKGILPDYRTLEDVQFGDEAANLKMPGLPGKYRGKIHSAAATVSEDRDHYIRIAHFIDRLNKSKGGSLDEIAETAASRVRKWHPDGSDLTHFESSKMRRLFLFYSWIRKAVPLVVESAVMKPGKVLVYPKAMQAVAEANGIDLNSIGDPFPAGELFPSWIRDQTEGPSFEKDGHFFSVSPGIPFSDVIGDYGTSTGGFLGSILGSLTPAAKVPIEMTYGSHQTPSVPAMDIRTGVPKQDFSDYIDQQIPGVNVVANLTNRSVSSGFTQNTGEGLGMSEQQQVKANEKNKPGPDVVALLNWLTGAGLTDLSKPSYKKGAQIEQSKARR